MVAPQAAHGISALARSIARPRPLRSIEIVYRFPAAGVPDRPAQAQL
jgi:hypothetical protein